MIDMTFLNILLTAALSAGPVAAVNAAGGNGFMAAPFIIFLVFLLVRSVNEDRGHRN